MFAMAALSIPKEYVRQQLQSLGVGEVTDEELEAYTKDFSRLVQEHLQHDTPPDGPTGPAPFLYSTGPRPHNAPGVGHPVRGGAAAEPGHTYTEAAEARYSPVVTHAHTLSGPPGSAVFKTFPGDKENRVQFLAPSATPSPLRVSPLKAQRPAMDAAGVSPSHEERLPNSVHTDGRASGRRTTKRKVLRRWNGELRVFDESLSETGSIGGPVATESMESRLSALSISSLDSTETSLQSASDLSRSDARPRGGRDNSSRDSEAHVQKHQCKSFIRPMQSQPRGFRKCDPVTRYHEWRQLWDSHKVPGEKSRNDLRWHIREQLVHQDISTRDPARRVHRPNHFVVPTEKKRLPLRWEIRHQMASH